MLVNTEKVSEEEIKYNLNNDDTIKQVSKDIKDGIGEAVGINKCNCHIVCSHTKYINLCVMLLH